MSIKIKISTTTEAERAGTLEALKAVIRRENLLIKVKKDAVKGRYLAYAESRKEEVE